MGGNSSKIHATQSPTITITSPSRGTEHRLINFVHCCSCSQSIDRYKPLNLSTWLIWFSFHSRRFRPFIHHHVYPLSLLCVSAVSYLSERGCQGLSNVVVHFDNSQNDDNVPWHGRCGSNDHHEKRVWWHSWSFLGERQDFRNHEEWVLVPETCRSDWRHCSYGR